MQIIKSNKNFLKRLGMNRTIEVSTIGGWYKARFAGKASCVFGATAAEAVERLELNALPSPRVPRGLRGVRI